MTTHLLALTSNAGIVMGLTVMLKELLLPKMNVYMPAIMNYVKALMQTLRAAMTRSVEHGTRLVGGHPKFASAYAMILLAASASRLSNELRFLARLILEIHGIPINALRMNSASDDEGADDVSNSGSTMSSSMTGDEQELDAEQPEEHDATPTGSDGTASDEEKDCKDYNTFWETRPSRDMSKQLTSQEIDAYKTDLRRHRRCGVGAQGPGLHGRAA